MRITKSTRSVFFTLVFSLILSSTSMISLAQSASIKNGVACKKSGQTAKSGAKRYVCGKNPYLQPKKLTWMLRECPQTYDLYVDSKEQYEIFKDILSSAGTEGKVESDKLLKGIADLEALMKTEVCKRGK